MVRFNHNIGSHQIKAMLHGCILSLFMCCSLSFADDNQAKPMYYRYIDSSGTATISRNVTPTHIQRGYDILDRNMLLLSHVQPYNAEEDLKKSNQRAAQSEQDRKDSQLLRSYRNVKYATEKKETVLSVIQKQIDQQYQLLRRLQTERTILLQQKSDAILNQQIISKQLQQGLVNNEASIRISRMTIEQLKTTYAEQEQQYDVIIQRLQELE